jgi:hypothetical protein
MLTLSPDQLTRLGQFQTDRFVDACAKSLHERHPAETEGETSADLRGRILALLPKLQAVGFECTGDIAHAIELILAFQLRPGKPAMPATLSAQLRDPHVSVEKKIEALEQLFLFDAA